MKINWSLMALVAGAVSFISEHVLSRQAEQEEAERDAEIEDMRRRLAILESKYGKEVK